MTRISSPRVQSGNFSGAVLAKRIYGLHRATAIHWSGKTGNASVFTTAGFASFVLYLPRETTSVAVFSNIYSSATTTSGGDIAAIVRGLPYERFIPASLRRAPRNSRPAQPRFNSVPISINPTRPWRSSRKDRGLSRRWPGGSVPPLIRPGRNKFVDRSYWEQVKGARDADGQPTGLAYGDFQRNCLSQETVNSVHRFADVGLQPCLP